MADVVEEVATTRAALNQANRLVADGWTRDEHGTSFTLRHRAQDPAPLAAALRTVAPLAADGRLRGQWTGDLLLEMQLVDGELVVAATSGNSDLEDAFADAQLDHARRAWDGDASAAVQLVGSWAATIAIDPARVIRPALAAWKVHVVDDLPAAVAFISRPWWTLAELLTPDVPTLVLTWREQHDFEIATAALVIRPLGGVPEAQVPLAASKSATLHAGIPEPRLLAPTKTIGPADLIQHASGTLWSLCAAASWAGLATAIVPSEDGTAARLQFFGFQRVDHTLPSAGPTGLSEAECRSAYDLWRWAVATEGPDHLLAVRQVVSLYRDVAPWARAEDVRLAAEPVFLALRADAIGEGFKVQRESRALALSVARQTAEAATALAKGAVERCLAALGAIGGIVIAKTTTNLTLAQAAHLRTLLAVFLVLLALWSIFVEGPPATAGIRGLQDDIGKLSPLLPEAEQRAILGLASVRRARRQARTVRVLVPIAYGFAAVAAVSVN